MLIAVLAMLVAAILWHAYAVRDAADRIAAALERDDCDLTPPRCRRSNRFIGP